jgi:pilus assembly protein CpaB
MAKRGGSKTAIIIIVVLIVIVVIAGGGLLALQFLGGGAEAGEVPVVGGQQAAPPTSTPAPTINIIIASRDIPRGTRLSISDVTTIAWPIIADAPPPFGALVVGDVEGAGLEQVEGRIARVDILAEQPVLDFMLTPDDQPIDLADVGSDAALIVPSGMVAMALPIDRLSSVAYALREGDHVDIMMSFLFVDVDEEFQTGLPNTGILVREDPEFGLQTFQYPMGREEVGLFGNTVLVVPNTESTIGIPYRRTTQLVIDNAMVLRMGAWPLADLNQPIVVMITPEPVVEETTPEPGAAEAVPGEPTPTPVPAIPIPDVITLAMSRQDALVLKYAYEAGANITLTLRSALDDDINDVTTDPVTLDYIMTFYNVPEPGRLPVALGRDIFDLLDETGTETTTP